MWLQACLNGSRTSTESDQSRRLTLEDTLLLPTGELATDNAAFMQAANALTNPSVA